MLDGVKVTVSRSTPFHITTFERARRLSRSPVGRTFADRFVDYDQIAIRFANCNCYHLPGWNIILHVKRVPLLVFCRRKKVTSTAQRTSFRRGHVFDPTLLLLSGCWLRSINFKLFSDGEPRFGNCLQFCFDLRVRRLWNRGVLLGNVITPF